MSSFIQQIKAQTEILFLNISDQLDPQDAHMAQFFSKTMFMHVGG